MIFVKNGDYEVKYTYYPGGLRKSKTVNNKVTEFVWDGSEIAAEIDKDYDVIRNKYIYGLDRVLCEGPYSVNTYYQQNSHGDTVATSNYSGATIVTYEYDAFGNQLNADPNDTNPFRYCGQYLDNETGSYYLRARYYSPASGRFLTEDPIRDGLNWYVYCANNPIVLFDPSGLDAIVANQKDNILGLGHMSAFVQDENGDWHFFYWGNKSVALVKVEDPSVLENVDSMNNWLMENGFVDENGFQYDAFCYIEGDFTKSYQYYNELKIEFDNNIENGKKGWFGF